MLAPAGARARDVTVSLSPQQLDATPRLLVRHCGATLLDGHLAHRVEIERCESGGDVVPDWELTDYETSGRRVVRVTLHKAVPASAMVLWWRSALQGGPAVDTTAFEERKGAAQRTAAARAVWQEAEAQFLENVRNRKQIDVDVSGDEDRGC